MYPNQPAVILARVSSKRQEEEGYSLPAQKKLLRNYALDRGLNPIKDFEIAETASKTEQRKIFKEAMKFIETHRVKHLVIEKVDRHVRNLHDAVETHDWLMADEAKNVHFVKDSLVLNKNSKSQEWLNWGIRVVMAKNYIDNLREEAMKGWAEKLAQGWLPAPPPPGYMTVTEKGKRIHVPDPKTRELIIVVFKKYLEPGQSILSVTEFAYTLGLRTRRNKAFSKSNMHKILTNPFYIGINRFDGRDYEGAQELFLPKKLFQAVQRKIHSGRPSMFKKHHSPLQGIIRCEDCGSLVTWQLQKGKYYGVCRRLKTECKKAKMLREDQVESLVVKELKRLVCPSELVIDWVTKTMRKQSQEQIDKQQAVYDSLKVQIARIESMDERLYDDKLSGEITQERYEDKHATFRLQKINTQELLDKIDKDLREKLDLQIAIIELSQKAYTIYPKKTPDEKRLIISKLFSELHIKSGVLSVKYSEFTKTIASRVIKTKELMEV